MTKLPLIHPKDLKTTIRGSDRNLVGGLPITHPLASNLPALAEAVAKLLGGEVTTRSDRSVVPTLRVLVPEDMAAELTALEEKCDGRAGLFFETEEGGGARGGYRFLHRKREGSDAPEASSPGASL